MTGYWIHKKTGKQYEVLGTNVIDKDNDCRCILYCDNQGWYVRKIDGFYEIFIK